MKYDCELHLIDVNVISHFTFISESFTAFNLQCNSSTKTPAIVTKKRFSVLRRSMDFIVEWFLYESKLGIFYHFLFLYLSPSGMDEKL